MRYAPPPMTGGYNSCMLFQVQFARLRPINLITMQPGENNPESNKENTAQQDPVNAGMAGKRQTADDNKEQDADENLPDPEKTTHETEDSRAADDLVQGKKLENKFRGGDANDADEFVPGG